MKPLIRLVPPNLLVWMNQFVTIPNMNAILITTNILFPNVVTRAYGPPLVVATLKLLTLLVPPNLPIWMSQFVAIQNFHAILTTTTILIPTVIMSRQPDVVVPNLPNPSLALHPVNPVLILNCPTRVPFQKFEKLVSIMNHPTLVTLDFPSTRIDWIIPAVVNTLDLPTPPLIPDCPILLNSLNIAKPLFFRVLPTPFVIRVFPTLSLIGPMRLVLVSRLDPSQVSIVFRIRSRRLT